MDIKSLIEAQFVAHNQLKAFSETAANSVAATWASQHAQLLKTVVPERFSALDAFVKQAEDERARYKELASPLHLRLSEASLASQASVLSALEHGSKVSMVDSVRQLDRFSAYAQVGNQFRDIIDRMEAQSAWIPDWLTRVEASEAHTRRLIESLADDRYSADKLAWAVLNQGLEDVEVAIQELPREPGSNEATSSQSLSPLQYLHITIALVGLLLAILTYVEALEQGARSQAQAMEAKAEAQHDLAEQREFRERVMASLEILAQSTTANLEYNVGPRPARLKSAINRGAYVCTLEPGQHVILLEHRGRWAKVRCSGKTDLAGWTPKHYLIRQ